MGRFSVIENDLVVATRPVTACNSENMIGTGRRGVCRRTPGPQSTRHHPSWCSST